MWKKLKALKSGSFVDNVPIESNGNLIIDSVEKANIFASAFQGSACSEKNVDIDNFFEQLVEANRDGNNLEYNGDILG